MTNTEILPAVTTQAAAPASAVVKTPEGLMAALAAKGFRVTHQVTRTVLKQALEVPFAVTIQEMFRTSELPVTGRGGSSVMKPADVANVLNLETGELQVLIGNTVLVGELNRAYPEGGYVGKSFAIMPKEGRASAPGVNAYKVYMIAEIDVAATQETGETVGEVVADASDPVNKAGHAPGKRK